MERPLQDQGGIPRARPGAGRPTSAGWMLYFLLDGHHLCGEVAVFLQASELKTFVKNHFFHVGITPSPVPPADDFFI